MDENRIVVTAVSQTTRTGELTSAVPCRGTPIAEECVPLSTVTCTPSSPPSRREPTQIISCSDSSVTDDKLHRHRECAESSVLVCASVALEETDISTPTRSRVITVEHTQKSSPASDDVRNSSFNRSTLTIVESHPLTADRHEEPYGQDGTRDRLSEVSSTPKLESGEEDVSTDHKRQTVEGRDDHHEKGTESEVKSNLTSYSRTVRIDEEYTSKSTISDDDGRVNEGADGAALSSINLGSKISPSERAVPQDSAANHIESGYEHRSSDVDTVSKSSIQIPAHDSTESSEGHVQRQDCEEVDSSVVVRVSLAPAETIGTPVPAPCRVVENTQESSLPEDTWTMGQTSSFVTDLEGGSSGHIVDTDLPTQCSSTPNVYVEHDKVPVSADCMHQDLACRGDYHARVAESEVTLKLESYSSAVESLRQSESVTVLKTGGRSDDAGINYIQSAREHRSSEINVASATLVQTSSHCSIESRVQSSLVTIQGDQDVATGQPCQRSSAPKIDSNELAECAHQAVESAGGRHELETEGEFKLSSTAYSHSVKIVERFTSETVVLEVDRKMDENTDVPTMPPTTTLPPSDPSIPQDAGTHFIQSGCEHQSSGIDTASIALMQTSSHDCSTKCEGYERAQSFSCCDGPEATLSAHVCLSSARNASDSPPSMDKAVENVQKSSLSNPGPKGPHSEPSVPQDAATPNVNTTLQNE
ncbi:hypothetical protein F4604DRAFT_1749359 [Suillus subluteus]|nr:hypothetical protein F4604DRAFT_1749359 [Suillus subluteus]